MSGRMMDSLMHNQLCSCAHGYRQRLCGLAQHMHLRVTHGTASHCRPRVGSARRTSATVRTLWAQGNDFRCCSAIVFIGTAVRLQARDGADVVERLERRIDAQAKHIREMDKVSLEPSTLRLGEPLDE